MNASNENYFSQLAAINVNDQIERKGAFSYLSWPWAVTQLRQFDPAATWAVKRFNDLPYLATETGYYVEVATTVKGVTLSQIHPVLDGKNRPILAPTSFDVNTSIMRCLVKSISLHGLGLYIYAGEDLPTTTEDENNKRGVGTDRTDNNPIPIRPVKGTISVAQMAQIKRLLTETGSEEKRLLEYFGLDTLDQIKNADYQRVIRSLENRRAA